MIIIGFDPEIYLNCERFKRRNDEKKLVAHEVKQKKKTVDETLARTFDHTHYTPIHSTDLCDIDAKSFYFSLHLLRFVYGFVNNKKKE